MPATLIVPVAKALYLCDGTIGVTGGKTDLVGLFNGIPAANLPHLAKGFVVFAQLSQGLGSVPFHIDVCCAANSQVVYTSNVHQVRFPNRNVTIQLAYTVPACRFPQLGLYLVEFCNNQWVADTTLVVY